MLNHGSGSGFSERSLAEVNGNHKKLYKSSIRLNDFNMWSSRILELTAGYQHRSSPVLIITLSLNLAQLPSIGGASFFFFSF